MTHSSYARDIHHVLEHLMLISYLAWERPLRILIDEELAAVFAARQRERGPRLIIPAFVSVHARANLLALRAAHVQRGPHGVVTRVENTTEHLC